ncbi:hypothetical protein HMPREF0290_2669 [Corynebacterium efficiens YS-314]|nr:hypothetical protein HMPREF0290_2669 [Corynebacterium efficiens YS-314]
MVSSGGRGSVRRMIPWVGSVEDLLLRIVVPRAGISPFLVRTSGVGHWRFHY